MSLFTYVLEQTAVYSLWQAPFAAQKFAPILNHKDFQPPRRVLDVGCGPGTNAHFFAKADYLGVDINARYIESARKKYKRNFLVADVTECGQWGVGNFDFILINSFLHHVDDRDAHKILSQLCTRVTEDGYFHILELVSPGDYSASQLLAKADRGKFARPLAAWRALFEKHLDMDIFEPYGVKALGITLWSMVYCKGRKKT